MGGTLEHRTDHACWAGPGEAGCRGRGDRVPCRGTTSLTDVHILTLCPVEGLLLLGGDYDEQSTELINTTTGTAQPAFRLQDPARGACVIDDEVSSGACTIVTARASNEGSQSRRRPLLGPFPV